VTPQDLGMSWAVSKKKPDFIGKRSFSRVENQNPLRKQLVGLLPVDGVTRLPEGSQIVEFCSDDVLPPPPVPMLGHVTSSYFSANLKHSIALALVQNGRYRVGEKVQVSLPNGGTVTARIANPIFLDPEGARQNV